MFTPTAILAASTLPTQRDSSAQPDSFFCRTISQLEKQILGRRIRRIGRHTRFSLIGAASCIQQAAHKPDTTAIGVFLGSAFGAASELLQVSNELTPSLDHLPSPIHFSSTVSNGGTFTIAKTLDAQGPNLTIVQEDFSFEGACICARLSLQQPSLSYALVGGVDENVVLREQVPDQLNYPPQTPLGEGSAWLLLGPHTPDALGEIIQVSMLTSPTQTTTQARRATISATIRDHQQDAEPLWLLPGVRSCEEDLQALQDALPTLQRLPYLPQIGWYPTAAAAGLVHAIQSGHTGLFLHLSQNAFGHHAFILFRLFPRSKAHHHATPETTEKHDTAQTPSEGSLP